MVGWNSGGTIEYSYSRANVEGTDLNATVGGLVGYAWYTGGGTIRHTYSTGLVKSNGNSASMGGLAGYVPSTGGLISSYYDKQTSSRNDTGKGTGLTTAQMKSSSNFSGWDFNGIWGISGSINNGYPYLRVMK